MRLFIAIEIDGRILQMIEAIRQRLRAADADVKWVEPENTHLTIKFIGHVDDSKVPQICEAASRAAAAVEPFDLHICGVGTFPAGRPRVLWVGAADPSGNLGKLHERTESALAHLGLPPEEREFTAHLTLGRVRSGRNVRRLVDMLAAEGPADLGVSRADSITLFESKLTPRGPIYRAVERMKLGAAGRQ